MTDSNKSPTIETPYNLELDSANKDGPPILAEEAGFYIAKNWFAKKKFSVYPKGQKTYKPNCLQNLDDNLWSEFNRDVQHCQEYFAANSWYYKIWALVPPFWFLTMVLPDLLWYYEIVFRGVGLVIGVIVALSFSLDTYLQRRLLAKKIQPMYSLLIATYKASFLKQGYVIRYVLEPTTLDGMCSYIVFRRATKDEQCMVDMEPQQSGFYLDEKLVLGNMPFAKGVVSTYDPPHFLQDLDPSAWKSFAKELNARKKTPLGYHKLYTIGMSFLVIPFVGALLYAAIVLANVRHWLLLALFPVYFFVETVVAFWRRHYVENVLVEDMKDLIKQYEGAFTKAGYGASFELEYKYNYLYLNTYMVFWQHDMNTASGDTLLIDKSLP